MKHTEQQTVPHQQRTSLFTKMRNYVIAYAERCRHAYLSLLSL
ncbi:hypothetical protein [Aggregatimonas sangjinii]|nr:hypothetical protein [Aggregatimonas sangjinii]